MTRTLISILCRWWLRRVAIAVIATCGGCAGDPPPARSQTSGSGQLVTVDFLGPVAERLRQTQKRRPTTGAVLPGALVGARVPPAAPSLAATQPAAATVAYAPLMPASADMPSAAVAKPPSPPPTHPETLVSPLPASVSARSATLLCTRRWDGWLEITVDKTMFRFVYVPPGQTVVGLGENDVRVADKPMRGFVSPRAVGAAVPARFEQGFFISETEVTNAQFLAVMRIDVAGLAAARRQWPKFLHHLSSPVSAAPDQPVRFVSWSDAAEFCVVLQALWNSQALTPGPNATLFRLPTELEWEYAARRGGTTVGRADAARLYPWGDADPAGLALTVDDTQTEPSTVWQARDDATPEGVRGLAAGVTEWCLDEWDARPWAEQLGGKDSLVETSVHAIRFPATLAPLQRSVRGGHFRTRNTVAFETVYRSERVSTQRSEEIGFRFVFVPP